jgi:N-methylhydantoinase A/oxoprolinase/acetone carboxylase beta subunit
MPASKESIAMGVVVGEDTGSTFTDLAAADARTGRKTILEVPSTRRTRRAWCSMAFRPF